MIDAHAHLAAVPPAEHPVAGWVVPGVDPERDAASAQLQDPRVLHAVGLHPWHLPDDLDAALGEIATRAEASSPCAIGETGLDRGRRAGPADRQEAAFRFQIALAQRLELPLILHVVGRHGAALQLIEELGFTGGGLVHDFAGAPDTIAGWTDAGFLLSVSPRGLRKPRTVAAIPDHHLLLETDEAGIDELDDLCGKVAAIRRQSQIECALRTAANARRLFPQLPA